MGLNKQKGNMYGFVTHTWNTIKGACPHDCTYCYMKRFKNQRPVRFDKSELKTDLGSGNFIFVGSSCDMFAKSIDSEWITDTLDHCRKFKNRYLFQTKNPKRLFEMRSLLPQNSTCGTTIETNRRYPEMGNAPPVEERAKYISLLGVTRRTMVTVEPIMDFGREPFSNILIKAWADQYNFGANTNHSVHLPEPTKEKAQWIISDIEDKYFNVHLKPNLQRLMK